MNCTTNLWHSAKNQVYHSIPSGPQSGLPDEFIKCDNLIKINRNQMPNVHHLKTLSSIKNIVCNAITQLSHHFFSNNY